MKLSIFDLFDRWESQTIPDVTVSVGRILTRTMAELPPRSRRWSPIRKLALIAAACLVLAGSALAYYRSIQPVITDSIHITMPDTQRTFDLDTNLVVTFEPPEDAHITPNLMALQFEEFPLPLHGVTLRTRMEHLEEAMQTDLFSSCTLSNDLLDSCYTSITTCDYPDAPDSYDERVLNVSVISSADVTGVRFIPWLNGTVEKEGTLCGMEAIWVAHNDRLPSKSILLYNPAYNCVIHIGVFWTDHDIGYELLEEIAGTMTLVDSGVPSVKEPTAADWRFFSVGVG